jgi:hypothetical protein
VGFPMRLVRSLWQVLATYPDRLAIEPPFPVTHDDASVLAPVLGEEGAVSAILRRVPGTRAAWEMRAPYEASDKPEWGKP